MASFDLMSEIVIAENPWSDTDLGRSSHYIRTRGRGGVSSAQQQQQEAFADAVQGAKGECSGLDGMARNRCRAMEIKSRL